MFYFNGFGELSLHGGLARLGEVLSCSFLVYGSGMAYGMGWVTKVQRIEMINGGVSGVCFLFLCFSGFWKRLS